MADAVATSSEVHAILKSSSLALPALGWLASLFPIALPAAAPDLSAQMANGDAVDRRRQLVSEIKSLRPEDIPAALNQAIAGHGTGRDDMINAFSGRWVELDAPTAIAFARQTTDRQAKACLESAYYAAWAKRDADGALNAARHADAGERATAIGEIACRIAGHDPKRAHELIRSVHVSKMPDIGYFLFWNWARKDLAEATRTLLQDAKTAGFSYPCQAEAWAVTDRLFDTDPNAAARWVAGLPAGKVRDQAFERLVSEWKKVDRDSLAQWLKAWPDGDQAENARLNLPPAAQAAPRSANADSAFAQKARVLDEILAESNFWLELEALVPFVDGLAPTEFPQALEHLRNIPGSNRNTVLDMLVARWSEVDPAGVLQAIPVANSIHDGEFSDRLLANIYAAWARRDPDAAFAFATSNPPGAGNYQVLRALFTALARQDPASAHARFQKLNNANSHMLVVPIFTEWADRDLPGATEALATERHSDGAIEGIIIGLMRKGPATAIAWAGQLSEESFRNRARRNIALRWPGDPQAAAAWLERCPDFEGKDRAFGHMAINWAIRNPTEALHYALGLAEGTEKTELIFWGMAQMTYEDADTAQRIARQLPDDGTKKQARTTVLIFWSEYAPFAAADFLSSIKREATPGDMAIAAAALSNRDALAAVHWLDAFPASADRSPAIEKIAKNWHRSDPPSAASWVRQLPSGPLYDAGVRGICADSQMDASQALRWARSIQDRESRRQTVKQAFESATSWRHMSFDSPEIKKEIQEAPELSDDDKKALMARFPVLIFSREPEPPQGRHFPAME